MTGSGAEGRAPALSVLFVTYARPALLERSLAALRPFLRGIAVEYVASDDGSPRAVQARVAAMGFDRCVMAPHNRGLGANNNQGLAACAAPLILMLQDDWQATEALDGVLPAALAVLARDADVGIIRFYGDPARHPPLEPRAFGNINYFVCDHLSPDYSPRFHVYSDTPHLRRAVLADPAILGPYKEGCAMEECEEDYSNRFERQSRYRVAFMSRTEKNYFLHLGGDASYRTRKFRYSLEAAVRRAAVASGLRPDGAVWRAARPAWFTLKRALIRAGIIK